MEEILGNLMKVATKKELTKIKSILRNKSSAAAENHALANSDNGAKQSGKSAGVRGKKSKQPSSLQNQQRGNDKKKKGNRQAS